MSGWQEKLAMLFVLTASRALVNRPLLFAFSL
jgi:hypothetical protein